MLARSSSDAATRMRRSKSTSSVYRPVTAPEYFDPAIAQKHAVAAAQSAFVKAHADGAAARYRSPKPEVIRTKSNASRKSLGSQGSHFPPRESSFKSLQPRQAGQGQGISRHTRAPAQVLEKFPPFQNTLGADYHHVPQPKITISTIDENVRPSSQLKSHRISLASSANSQQIRKTRSMFYASTIQTGSPLPRSHANPTNTYLTTPPSVSTAPDTSRLSGRRSAPLSAPLPSPRLPVTVAPNETVDQARDRYLQGFKERQLQKKPSLFLAPFRKRQDKGKDKAPKPPSSARGVSTTSRRTQVETPLEVVSNHKSQKDKRSLSNSIKEKFKKVFRKSSNTTPPALPVQQIEASRDYFGDYATHAPASSEMNRSLEIPSPTEGQIQRLQSRTPSSDHERPLTTRSPSRPESRESGKSLQSESSFAPSGNSRSSSWASSTVRGRLKDRIKNRLSTVPENKNSISSLAGQPIVISRSIREPAPTSPLASFQDPMHDSLLDVSVGVDPKRVFSALQREIAASGAAPRQYTTFEPASEIDSDVFGATTQKVSCNLVVQDVTPVSSTASHHGGSGDHERLISHRRTESVGGQSTAASKTSTRQTVRGTIRSVKGESAPDSVPDRASSVRGAVRIPRPDTTGSPGLDSPTDTSGGTTGTINFVIGHENPLRPPSRAEHTVTPTPQVLASRREKVEGKWQGMLKPPHQPAETSAANALQIKGKSTFGKIARRAFSSRALKEHGTSKSASSPAQPVDQVETEVIVHETQYAIIPDAQEAPHPPEFQSTPPLKTREMEPAEIAEDSQYTIKPESPRPLKAQQPHWPLSPSIYSRNTDGDSFRRNESMLSFDGMSDGEEDSEGGTIVITSPPFKAVSYPLVRSPDAVRRLEVRHVRPSEEHRNFLRDSLSILDTDVHADPSQPARHARHRRELTQIDVEEEDIAIIVESPEQLSSPEEELAPQLPPQAPSPSPREEKSHNSEIARQDSPQSAEASQTKTSKTSAPSSRKTSPRPPLNTTPSDGSSRSRQTSNSRTSSIMNDRYPILETARQSKRNSAALSQKSRSTPNSSEASSSRKNTPSSRVYSDYSGAHVTAKPDKTSKHVRQRHSRLTGTLDLEKDVSANMHTNSAGKSGGSAKRGRSIHANVLLADHERNASEDAAMKENMVPRTGNMDRIPRHVRTTGALKSLADLSKNRKEALRSLEGLSHNHSSPALSPYTTSAKDVQLKAHANQADSTAQRPALSTIAARTMGRLPLATKSAFELRTSNTPTSASLPLKLTASESPKKRQRHDTMYLVERKQVAGRALEGDTLRMLQDAPLGRDSFDMFQETPWAATGYTGGRDSPLSRPSLAGKQSLHMKTSSSTLALNKEPSPGTEERTIESLLTFPQLSPKRNANKDTPSRAGSVTPSYVTPLSHNSYTRGTGRDTPGHRMAESFVRQREAGSGVGTPANVSPVNQPNVVGFTAFFDPASDRSDASSPAFL
ncbi:hypothetical protein BDV96DRAFT_293542 [Lophiotrema nucula]|uniref:Uncharacterized protein n=1 Tax=Lophiotrema nucula TaxID=690887 RepID=A0A6A5YL33_9PLEO|nr:hypothetical protein BDV96DRAFT_293542 [Lophiotrema nucula]